VICRYRRRTERIALTSKHSDLHITVGISTMISACRRSVLQQARLHLRTHTSVPAIQLSPLSRLLSSLAVLEHREGKLQTGSLGCITAARELGGSVAALIAGSGAKSVAKEAAKVDGLEKIITVENAAYDKVFIYTMALRLESEADRMYRCSVGLTGEFCPSPRRDHKGWELHTCFCWSFSIWKESHATGGSPVRLATNFRYNSYRERR